MTPAPAPAETITTTARYDRRGERAKKRAASLLHVPYEPATEVVGGRKGRTGGRPAKKKPGANRRKSA